MSETASKPPKIQPKIVVNKHESPLLEAMESKRKEIYDAEFQLIRLKAELTHLTQQHEASIVIKWTEEIRQCMDCGDEDFLKSPGNISGCVASYYSLTMNRNIRNNISTTLSIMNKSGEIGRLIEDGVSYYGLKKYFNDDLKTLKDEYINIERLR